MTVFRLAISALIPALFATVVSAQSPPHPGERIRVQLSSLRLTGLVVESTDQTLRLAREDGREYLVAWSDVADARRSTGRRSGRKAFILGLVGSAVAAGTVMAVTWDPCRETGFLPCLLHPASRGEAFQWGFVGGAVLGLGVGALAAGIASRERWEPIAIPGIAGASLSVRPLVGPGFGVQASLALGGG